MSQLKPMATDAATVNARRSTTSPQRQLKRHSPALATDKPLDAIADPAHRQRRRSTPQSQIRTGLCRALLIARIFSDDIV
jgi:hypothetical protein